MSRQHLVVDAADPMLARADLAIRHGLERRAERLAEFAEHLLRRVEGNAADQKDVLFHTGAPDSGRDRSRDGSRRARAQSGESSRRPSAFCRLRVISRARRSEKLLASLGRSPSSTRASSYRRCAASSLKDFSSSPSCASAVTRLVARIDLQDRLRRRHDAARAVQQLFQRAVGAAVPRRPGTPRCRSGGRRRARRTPPRRAWSSRRR